MNRNRIVAAAGLNNKVAVNVPVHFDRIVATAKSEIHIAFDLDVFSDRHSISTGTTTVGDAIFNFTAVDVYRVVAITEANTERFKFCFPQIER